MQQKWKFFEDLNVGDTLLICGMRSTHTGYV